MTDLTAQCDQAAAQVRQALAKPLPLETRRRLEAILTEHETKWAGFPDLSADDLQSLRAVEALEISGSAEARSFLAELARGAGARLTRHAKEASERIK